MASLFPLPPEWVRVSCKWNQCRVHRLAVALPKPGEYVHDVIVMKELPRAISCTLPDRSKLELNLEDRFLAIRVKVQLLLHSALALSSFCYCMKFLLQSHAVLVVLARSSFCSCAQFLLLLHSVLALRSFLCVKVQCGLPSNSVLLTVQAFTVPALNMGSLCLNFQV